MEETTQKSSRTFKAKLGPFHINLNPVVTLISASVIWGFAVWAMVDTDNVTEYMAEGKRWITDKFTWLYIGTQDAWFLFVLVVYFSKYGKMKLGRDDEEPEFSDAAYFTMLFSAGIAIGLFYFGVAEPIYHYEPGTPYGNRYWGRYSDNQRAQDAINLTLFHWGIHGWIVYAVVGLLMAFVAYRKGLPMTIRSCFYPLIGDRMYGWMGDLIDSLSVIATMFGVCTSLGIGVVTINSALNRVNSDIEENTNNQIICIWVITAIATISVISGLKIGIKYISEVCFTLGMFLMMFVLFYDDTWFLLNLYVQSIGYYIQWIIQLGFHTDAFAQLGNAPDGKQAPDWMDGWTIFYWGWWIAWSPFVGMFIAKISRGRTVRNFINATLTAPIFYTFLWFCIFGGAGLRMERDAALKGIKCSSGLGGTNATEGLDGLYRLSCRKQTQMYFDVLDQYGENLSGLLRVVSLIAMVLYFVTSSDSGSLIIDCLSANGNPEPPVLQRIFWALTEGACATALLYTGGSKALTALQTVSIAGGLVYTIILNFMCVALWRVMKEEGGDIDPDARYFPNSIFAFFDFTTAQKTINVVVSIFAPWWLAGKTAGKVYGQKSWPHMLTLGSLFYGWIALLIFEILEDGLAYIGWVVLCGFFAYVTGIRLRVRARYQISGTMSEDALAVVFLYPLAIDQTYEAVLLDGNYSASSKEKRPQPTAADIGLDNLGKKFHDPSNGNACAQSENTPL